MKRMADLIKITAQTVNDDTDLDKVKLLFTRTVPKVEKAVRQLENTLQQYSRLADPHDLDDLTEQVKAATRRPRDSWTLLAYYMTRMRAMLQD